MIAPGRPMLPADESCITILMRRTKPRAKGLPHVGVTLVHVKPNGSAVGGLWLNAAALRRLAIDAQEQAEALEAYDAARPRSAGRS